jgi:hypothetical protein
MFIDQKLKRVERLISDNRKLFSRQASVVATWRTVGERRLGPYYSLRYRNGRRQRSVYLGESAELAVEVRGLIAAAKRARREQLALRRMRSAVKASLRDHMNDVRHQLAQIGLTLKGFEVRGWRDRNATQCSLHAPREGDGINVNFPHQSFTHGG